ncbi:ATP-binding protein [Paraferrimonas sedimenticola]|uniref:ATP-binding protein n=1 Tax=Paraferrimonas sedimenticola TaxID=375674 RepID=A0AA37VTJ3_9GAMM|nr:ATP-binding protein [Paraferrimonas sedimenticola]GLP95364.1 ATP-binding protein [Paraferrimonas sedimenticola]
MQSLLRILLIDTHLPGYVELKVNGHTNICGTNASGKTTLQRLLPVFYGEAPSRVVPATRDSFQAWYLPRETSYIVYEYQRSDDQVCMAILTGSANAVVYRLVDAPFELSDFLGEDLTGEVRPKPVAELMRYFRGQKLICSNKLNNKEYRGVIQNDRSGLASSSDRRNLQALARQFSLCDSQHSLRHIEKLIRAVHSREGKMETIKAMIAAILEEDGVQTPTQKLSRNKVEDWLNECQLVRDFDGLSSEFEQVLNQEHQLSQTQTRLGQLKHQLNLDKAELVSAQESQQIQWQTAKADLAKVQADWDETRDSLALTVSQSKADVKRADDALNAIEDEFNDWQDKDIDTHKHNLSQLEGWQSELEGANQEYRLLTEQHQDIEAAYNQQLAEKAERLNRQQDKLIRQKDEHSEQLAARQREAADALQSLLQEQNQRRMATEQDFDGQLHQLQLTLERLRSGISLAGPSAEEQQAYRLIQANVEQASEQEDASRQSCEQVQAEVSQLKRRQHQAERSLDNARRDHQSAEAELARVQQLRYPGDNTLLEYLRSEVSDWQSHIGKVIDPSLLSRKDLKPGSSSHSQAELFGVHLDLSAIEAPEFARSEAELEQMLSVAETNLNSAENAKAQAESELAKITAELRQQEQVLVQAQSERLLKTEERQRLQQAQRQLQQEHQQALNQRKRNAEAEFDAQKRELAKLESKKVEALEQLKDEFGQQKGDFELHWQQICADIETEIDALETQRQTNHSQHKVQIKELKQWFKDELAARDVDVEVIAKLKGRIEQLKQNIQDTQQMRHQVADYERWYQQIYTKQKTQLQASLSQSQASQAEAERQQNQAQAKFREEQKRLKALVGELDTSLQGLRERLNQLAELLGKLASLALPKSAEIESGDVEQRLDQAQQLLRKYLQLTDALEAQLRQFDNRIGQKAGTSLSEFWEHSRQACFYQDEQGIPRLNITKTVEQLKELIFKLIPQKREVLHSHGRNLGNTLSQYHAVLKDIDKAIGQQSRRISQAVEQELFLDGVSDSSVHIRSRISELEFWPELERFGALHQAWLADDEHQLPNQDYGDCFKQVLDILGRAVTQQGISQLLDVELKLTEGKSQLLIRTDKQLNESSSHGMAYLILCKFLLAFTRLLRGQSEVTIHWPIDEIGTLAHHNVKKIFDACASHQITVVGAFPNPESEVLNLFANRYLIDKQKKQLQTVEPAVSSLKQRLAERRQIEEVSA